jgi:hypothetical protein
MSRAAQAKAAQHTWIANGRTITSAILDLSRPQL